MFDDEEIRGGVPKSWFLSEARVLAGTPSRLQGPKPSEVRDRVKVKEWEERVQTGKIEIMTTPEPPNKVSGSTVGRRLIDLGSGGSGVVE